VGAVERGLWPVVFVIMASSLLAVVYVGRVIEVAYFRAPQGAALEARDPPVLMLVPMLALALAVVWFGLDTRMSVGMAADAAARLIGGLK
jgi:multicomponent Na+:H+ antiporter subunit D